MMQNIMQNILRGITPEMIAANSPLAQGQMAPQAPGKAPGFGQRMDSMFSELGSGLPGGMSALMMGANILGGGSMASAVPQMQQMQSFKQRKMARDEVSKIAKDILGNLDVDGDGVVSPQEREIGNAARTALAAPDPNVGMNILNGVYQNRAALATPRENKPLSTMGKLAADLQAGVITPEQFKKAFDAIGTGGVDVTVNAGNQPLTTGTLTNVQKDIIGAERTLNDLSRIGDAYSDDFLTAFGRAKSTVGGWLDKAGVGGDLAEFNAQKGVFGQNMMQFFNQYRKEITGTAAGEKEMEMLLDSMMNENLGPREFKLRFESFWNKARANLELNKRMAREGIPVAPDDGGSDVVDWNNL